MQSPFPKLGLGLFPSRPITPMADSTNTTDIPGTPSPISSALHSPFSKLSFFPSSRPPTPSINDCAAHAGITTAPAAFSTLMGALRAYGRVAATLGSLAPRERAPQLAAAREMARAALEGFVSACEEEAGCAEDGSHEDARAEGRRQGTLLFDTGEDSESVVLAPRASRRSSCFILCEEVDVAEYARGLVGGDGSPLVVRRKETVVEDLEPYLLQCLAEVGVVA
ncbi:hypothetical protein K488DRAFT_91097 [Vararia minispora EC-137]|uniref:Uncharacterized protein n=1 Tax=Vararia minispora EC-137 TaxID=1314806 RepID=A0ACB8Q6V5_9AGAM|nr:hypothetical protein K488DRAFT_91097 [Vararia minispora EC-137]